jgi:hypothetical protein
MELGPPKKLKEEITNSQKTKQVPYNGIFGHNPLNKKEKLEKVLKTSGKKILGSGAECIATDEGNGRVLVMKYREFSNPIEAKKEFYLHKILSTIFPKNFPKMYASFAKGEDNISNMSSTIRQKIQGQDMGSLHKDKLSLGQHLKMAGVIFLEAFKSFDVSIARDKKELESYFKKENEIQEEIQLDFKQVEDSLKIMGIEINLDKQSCNFIRDSNNNMYYVDRVEEYKLNKNKKEQLLSFMKEKNFSDSDTRIVEASFDRIFVLESEKLGAPIDVAQETKEWMI